LSSTSSIDGTVATNLDEVVGSTQKDWMLSLPLCICFPCEVLAEVGQMMGCGPCKSWSCATLRIPDRYCEPVRRPMTPQGVLTLVTASMTLTGAC
jgi:hypothetical protein